MSKSLKEKAVIKRAAELEYPTDRCGAGSLMCQSSHINASRLIMVNHQLGHMVNIKDPEPPLVPAGFENVLAAQSTMLETSDGDYEIVAKFVKNDYNYIIIGFDRKRRIFNAWKRTEMVEHSEGFATRYKNSYIDSLDIGDVVNKDQLVKKSESFDKYGNYCFGKNLNTIYLVSPMVFEDGLALMNGAEKMMPMVRSHTVTIPLDDNAVMLNWYGDKDEYQALPKIGEKTRKGILAAVRTIDSTKAPYALKKKRLQSIERGDLTYPVSGRVIDIDILYNKERSKLIDINANKQVNTLYEEQQEFYRSLYRYMIEIVDNADDNGYTYSDEFSIICEEAHLYVDSATMFADNNDHIFGNMMIRVRIMNEEDLYVGSKLVGRAGNKGVVSEIVPVKDSWKMEDGRPIHVIVAALGVVGRLNHAQLNEHSITDLQRICAEMLMVTPNVDDKGSVIYTLMSYLNADQAKKFKKYYVKKSKTEKEKVCRRAEKEGLFIVQDPVNNANITDIAKAYEAFPPSMQRIVFPDGGKSMNKVVCAPLFFMRLKQDPVEKYSVRYRGPVNPLTMLPAKSNRKKKYIDPFSDVAVRFGEQEMEVLLTMCNHPAAISDFMAQNSTSMVIKIEIARQNYLGDPEEFLDLSNCQITGKKNIEVIDAYTNILGSSFDIDVEYAPPGEYFEG